MSPHPVIVDQILTRTKTKDMGTATTQSGIEPPSGIQGKGTVDEPYDQGNAPEEIGVQSGQEPLSGVQGKGTAAEPYDQGNAGESTASSQPTNTSNSNGSLDPKTASNKATDEQAHPSRKRSEQRDVSPGTMPDGSHARTSGDRGESYEPSKGLNRLKGKLGMGKH
ncbi:hypothetical protein CLCR_06323 [Cladophialophora carrionii]|uniref:Uncharacterized protein n=1 Tax=Cladophialophora carrionii TaxID=86049 RepID=A0A1C1C8Y8_9EURO|nr:hypothetical protein CLCR_06323 [Cladophialophora carrionii]